MITFEEYLNERVYKGLKADLTKEPLNFRSVEKGDNITINTVDGVYKGRVLEVFKRMDVVVQFRLLVPGDEFLIWSSSDKDKQGNNIWVRLNDPVELLSIN